MAVTVYMGRAGTGKTTACYERIKEIMAATPGEPVILLVPDSATYKAERDLAAFMPGKGFTSVRVVGFSRFAYQVFRSVGSVRTESLSDTGQKLLLRLIMRRGGEHLELLEQVARQPHFSDVLQQFMAECRAFQVEPEELAARAEKVDSLVLRRKLQELSRLLGDYNGLVTERYGDQADRMEELIRLLPESPLVKGAHVFIDGFHWFTPVQMELVRTLFDLARESVITLTLPVDSAERQKQSRPGALFNRPLEVLKELQETYGGALQVRLFAESKRFTGAGLEELAENFFRTPVQAASQKGKIRLLEAYNRDREADAVCRQMLALMQEGQYRWRDFTIMLRESETYGDVLEKNLTHYEIPFFTDRRHPMISHPLAEFLNGLMDIVRSHFDHDAMFRLLKTDFFPLTRLAVDELENYCLEFGIRDFTWLQKEDWSWRRLAWSSAVEEKEEENGLAESTSAEEAKEQAMNAADPGDPEEARLARINETRRIIMTVLRPWWEFAAKEHTGREWGEELFQLIRQIGIPAALTHWHEEALEAGETAQAAAHEQMYKQVLTLLEEVMTVCQTDGLTAEEMGLLLTEGLEEVTYSLVPPTLDHVTVTTIERGYTGENEVVFVMGLNEGIFPQRMGDEGILKDKERESLKEAGITLSAGTLDRAFNENFLLYLACTRARQELYVSYASANAEGSTQEVSLAVNRLRQLGYCGEPERAPLTIMPGEEAAYLWRPHQSLSLLALQAERLSRGEELNPLWWSLYEWARTGAYAGELRLALRGVSDQNIMPLIDREVVEALFLHQHTITGSVTRIERYQQCPFSFFAQYGLRLEPRRIRQFAAPEIGTFLHENLRVMGEELLKQQRQWRDLADEERAALCSRVADDMAREMAFGLLEGDDFYRNIKERLTATLERTTARLTDWSRRSAFNTAAVEQGFGRDHSGWRPVYIPLGDDHSVRLQGQIDRVDLLAEENHQYALVVDYKSGGAGISAEDVYYGLKLQLLTYLLALERTDPTIEPAALVYTYVKNSRQTVAAPVTADEARQAAEANKDMYNKGYFQEDRELLSRLDEEVLTGVTPYVPVKFNKDGGPAKASRDKLKNTEQFRRMTSYTERIIAGAGRHILAGHFPISPYNIDNKRIPCAYCQYRSVCRFERSRPDNTYRYLPRLSEEQGLEKMKEGGDVYEVDNRSAGSH